MSCFYKKTMASEESSVPDEPELRIVLLGMVGAGKSSSGNTILNETKPFLSKRSMFYVTETCQKKTGIIDGQNVAVVDTPGLLDTERSQEEVVEEIKKSISLAKPGPHVFLIVLKMKVFTEEKKMMEIICRTFGKNTMAYTMVLFNQENTQQVKSIEDFIDSNRNLRNLIIQCHGKYHVFDNNDESHDQVAELLQKINSMIQTNRGSFYTAEMLQEAETALKEQQQVQNPKGVEANSPIRTSGLSGIIVGCLMGYFGGGGQMTSTIGAAVGGIAVGILGAVSAGLVITAKKHIKKCTKK